MLHSARAWKRIFVALVTLVVVAVGPVQAAVDRAEPLIVPAGLPPVPSVEDGPLAQRLERAAGAWRARGYRNLPTLASAAIAVARRDDNTALALRARDWAPNSPAVQFESGLVSGDLGGIMRGLRLIPNNFPAYLWIGVVGFGALGVACILATAVIAILSLFQAFPVMGHAFGHLWGRRSDTGWPGALTLGSGVAALLLLGAGPVLAAGAAVAVGIAYRPARKGFHLMVLLTVTGLFLGPGLDRWSAAVAVPATRSELLAAWRSEQAQPLPGDRELLEERVKRDVATPVERLALAALFKREGNLERSERVLMDLPSPLDPRIGARTSNLRGTLKLARGNVRDAIQAFTEARAQEPSGRVLYNLSQAYGRGIQLEDQQRLFEAAKREAPELVAKVASYSGTNFNHYVVEDPLPVTAYLEEALRSGVDSRRLSEQIRLWTLGPRVPAWGWLLLPMLGLFGLIVTARAMRRCPRCLRSICQLCSRSIVRGPRCLRCKRLSGGDAAVDSRVLRREIKRDEWRQSMIRRGAALLGTAIPGSTDILAGRISLGIFLLCLALTGAVLLVGSSMVPTPSELGGLGGSVMLCGGIVLLATVYLAGGLRVVARARAENPE